MTDVFTEIDQTYSELVEWVASILNQYTITELWSLEFVYFHKVKDWAESIQRQRMAKLNKSRPGGRRRK